MNKTCFKCNQNKDISEYYKHAQMSDGHLNKCKDCTKKDIHSNTMIKSVDEDWILKEKERHRLKYHRLGYKDLHKQDAEQKAKCMKNYEGKYPEKKKAHSLCSHLRASVKGNQLHHWSYNEVHAKDVIEISVNHHYTLHRHIEYDQETKFYKFNRILLNTKEKMIYVARILDLKIF